MQAEKLSATRKFVNLCLFDLDSRLFIDSTSKRKCISSLLLLHRYDSDEDVSFVQPYADKKAVVSTQTLLDKITVNAVEVSADISKMGQKFALQAIESFVAPAGEESEDDSDDDSRRHRSRRRRGRRAKKTMERILECGANLKSVAADVVEELPNHIEKIPNPW